MRPLKEEAKLSSPEQHPIVSMGFLTKAVIHPETAQRQSLNSSGGGGMSTDMSQHDFHGRLAKIEGGFAMQQWAAGIVSAAMLAALAIVIAVTLSLRSDISDLEGKVDALPEKIRAELRDLNDSFGQAITAARSMDQPTIVVVPQSPLGIQQATPDARTPDSPSD